MRLRLGMLALIFALLVGVVSPGFASQVSAAPAPAQVTAVHNHAHAAAFDKTKFVLHLAVAAFLVHYIYKKYKQGKLGRSHIFTTIKAAVAALFAYHEMKKAYDIAKTSNSKTLHILISPMTALTGTLSAMASKLRHGDTSGVSTANSEENGLQTAAKATPYSFKDQQPAGYNPGF